MYVEKFKQWRVTLLPGVLLAAKHTVFLVAGEDKAEAVRAVFKEEYDPKKYPAQIASPPWPGRHVVSGRGGGEVDGLAPGPVRRASIIEALYMSFDWTFVGLSVAAALLAGLALAWALALREPSLPRLMAAVCILLLLGLPPDLLARSPGRSGPRRNALRAARGLASLCRRQSRIRHTARSLGASDWRIFWRLTLPLAWPAILLAALFALLRVAAAWNPWT